MHLTSVWIAPLAVGGVGAAALTAAAAAARREVARLQESMRPLRTDPGGRKPRRP